MNNLCLNLVKRIKPIPNLVTVSMKLMINLKNNYFMLGQNCVKLTILLPLNPPLVL